MQKQVTAEEIILGIVESMMQGLEPLLYTKLAPSSYQVYLRGADHERLRGIFPAVAAEAKRALDEGVEELNRPPEPPPRGLWQRFLALWRPREEATPVEHIKPSSGWKITFVPDDDIGEGERFKVEAMLELPEAPEYGGNKTVRVTTVSSIADVETRRLIEEVRASVPGFSVTRAERSAVASSVASSSAASSIASPVASSVASSPAHAASTVPVRESAAPEPVTPSVPAPSRPPEIAYARLSYEDNSGHQNFSMRKTQIVIGRGGRDYWVDLKLETTPDVSHEHLRIRYDEREGRFYVKDLSTFGTTVNGERIASSVEVVEGRKRDCDLWVPLPGSARLGLADVVYLDFKATGD